MRVIVTGRLKERTFDDKEGQRRTVVEIDAEEIAASLMYATAPVTKTFRNAAAPQAGPPLSCGPASDSAQQDQSTAPADSHPF
jgi:single-strand DNA-binding protein